MIPFAIEDKTKIASHVLCFSKVGDNYVVLSVSLEFQCLKSQSHLHSKQCSEGVILLFVREKGIIDACF